jgi:uncharacterized membrane protein YidH (DUF202 family)
MERSAGLTIVVVGLGVVVVGVLVWAGAFSWFGRLPGDLRHQGERSLVVVPITSMLLVSVALTVLLNLLARFLR